MDGLFNTSLVESSALNKHKTLIDQATTYNLSKSTIRKPAKRYQLRNLITILSLKIISPFLSSKS